MKACDTDRVALLWDNVRELYDKHNSALEELGAELKTETKEIASKRRIAAKKQQRDDNLMTWAYSAARLNKR